MWNWNDMCSWTTADMVYLRVQSCDLLYFINLTCLYWPGSHSDALVSVIPRNYVWMRIHYFMCNGANGKKYEVKLLLCGLGHSKCVRVCVCVWACVTCNAINVAAIVHLLRSLFMVQGATATADLVLGLRWLVAMEIVNNVKFWVCREKTLRKE